MEHGGLLAAGTYPTRMAVLLCRILLAAQSLLPPVLVGAHFVLRAQGLAHLVKELPTLRQPSRISRSLNGDPPLLIVSVPNLDTFSQGGGQVKRRCRDFSPLDPQGSPVVVRPELDVNHLPSLPLRTGTGCLPEREGPTHPPSRSTKAGQAAL